jgi:hypothetical protein
VLEAAEREAKRLKDGYISVEHLVIDLAEEGTLSASARILASHNVTRGSSPTALTKVRGTSGSPPLPRRAPTRRWRSTAATWSPKAWPSASCAATSQKACATRQYSLSTWTH